MGKRWGGEGERRSRGEAQKGGEGEVQKCENIPCPQRLYFHFFHQFEVYYHHFQIHYLMINHGCSLTFSLPFSPLAVKESTDFKSLKSWV